MNRALYIAVCCLCGLLAATIFHFRGQLVLPFDNFKLPPFVSAWKSNSSDAAAGNWPSFSDGIEKAAPSVLSVYTLRTVYSDQSRSPGLAPNADQSITQRGEQTNQGSGVVVDPMGLIVTSYHLIAGADTIYIALADDRLLQAEIVGTDVETDLALIRIAIDEPLTALDLSSNDAAKVGDVVLAIGNPYGVGQTVTLGIVSAVRRQLTGISALQNFLQIDAAINPGNSGGALVDPGGDLVGINTAVYSRLNGAQGIGFAIPVSLVKRVVPQLLEHGRVIRGWLGVAVDDLINYPNLFAGSTNGAIVVAVVEPSPAYDAGLRRGDVIVAIDNKPVRRSNRLLTDVADSAPGTTVLLSIERDRQPVNLTVTVAERPALSTRR